MASFVSVPQFLAPRGIPAGSIRFLALRNNARPGRPQHPVAMLSSTPASGSSVQQTASFSTSPRSAAAKPKPKPKPKKPPPPVLEKPDKFRPPSHPARRVMQTSNKNGGGGAPYSGQPRNYAGPPLSPEEIEENKKKRYPNSFPPEGTVMFRFLTNRGIHIWISLSILFSLATFTFTTNFKKTSLYAHLLPPWSALLTSPFSAISQAFSVYRMHTEHVSLQTAEKRKRRVDDVEKRREYRVAHGLEEPGPGDKVAGAGEGQEGGEVVQRKPKRWLGIW